MEQDFIITSTNNIEGGVVKKYFGVINNNVVIGTNIFSDIGASIIDVFGGYSDSYQNKLKKIYDTSIQNLKFKAKNLGANAILGLSIDFDEISGGNKSMFMISTSGTAVYVDYLSNKNEIHPSKTDKSISNEFLTNEIIKKDILGKIQKGKSLTQEEWFFINQNTIPDISQNLLNTFLKNYDNTIMIDSEKGKQLFNNISNYFKTLDTKTSANVLYGKIFEFPTHIIELLKSNNLFCPEDVLEIIEKKELGIAINCLSIDKISYSKEDLNLMKKIIFQLDNIEDKGSIKSSKNLLGKEKDKYICPNGHSNDLEYEFCLNQGCQLNIKGLNLNQVEEINKFKNKVSILESLLS